MPNNKGLKAPDSNHLETIKIWGKELENRPLLFIASFRASFYQKHPFYSYSSSYLAFVQIAS
jgi:hypothetical protein